MIPEMKDKPYLQRLQQLNLWTLEDRRIKADLNEVFEMIHGYSNVKVETFFEFDNNSRTRDHTWKLKKNRFNKDLH